MLQLSILTQHLDKAVRVTDNIRGCQGVKWTDIIIQSSCITQQNNILPTITTDNRRPRNTFIIFYFIVKLKIYIYIYIFFNARKCKYHIWTHQPCGGQDGQWPRVGYNGKETGTSEEGRTSKLGPSGSPDYEGYTLLVNSPIIRPVRNLLLIHGIMWYLTLEKLHILQHKKTWIKAKPFLVTWQRKSSKIFLKRVVQTGPALWGIPVFGRRGWVHCTLCQT